MTLQQEVGYKNLPHDSRFYRLDYVGAVHRHSDPSLNLNSLSIHFTPVIPDFPRSNKIFNSPSVDKYHKKPNRPFQFNVGDLLKLKAGSVWKDGVCVWEPLQENAEVIGLDLAKTPVTYKRLNELSLDGHAIPYYGTDMNVWVACIEYKGDPEGIIVPAMELIRFYFANSSKFTHAVFNRGAHDLNTLVNVKECYYFDGVKLARVMLRKDYRDDDGPIIARMFRDDNALKAARIVWDSIYQTHTQRPDYFFFYPKAYFPFVGTTELSCFSKSVKNTNANADGSDRWHKFVHTILGCTAPFGFNILSLTRENDNSKGAVDNPGVKERNVPHKARANIQDAAQIDTTQRPDANVERELIRMEVGRFTALNFVELIKEEKYQQKTKNLKKTSLVPKNDPYTSLSTGLESYAQDANAAGVDYSSTNVMERKQPTPRKAAIDASLRNTATMLNGLVAQHGAVITSLFPSSSVEVEGVKLGEFPLKTTSKPVRKLHWSKYEDGARRLVAVKVEIGSKVRYLFDFERRGHHEKFAIYLCSTDLDDDQIAASLDGLLEDIAEARAVGLKDVFEDFGLQVKSVPHSSTSNLGFIDRTFKAFIG
jgi:hypothetical protein